MIALLSSLALAAAPICPLEDATSVVGSKMGHVLVTTPTGMAEYNAQELQTVATSCGYTQTAAQAATWAKHNTWGWATCGVGVCLLWPVGIAAPFYWVAARQDRDALGPILIREANADHE